MCICVHMFRAMSQSLPTLVLVSSILVLVHAQLALVDGIYVHLWRLRLFARPDSWREHVWHTARAALAPGIIALVFAAPTAGLALWLGVGLLAVDQLAEVADVLDERASRASLGGLGSGEYLLHVVLVALRAAAVALTVAARPAAAWSLDAVGGATYPGLLGTLVAGLVPGAVAVAALHVGLAWRYRPGARPARMVA